MQSGLKSSKQKTAKSQSLISTCSAGAGFQIPCEASATAVHAKKRMGESSSWLKNGTCLPSDSIWHAHVQISTPKLSSELKSQLRQRVSGGWQRVHWELAERPTLRQLQLLRARIGVMNQHVGFLTFVPPPPPPHPTKGRA